MGAKSEPQLLSAGPISAPGQSKGDREQISNRDLDVSLTAGNNGNKLEGRKRGDISEMVASLFNNNNQVDNNDNSANYRRQLPARMSSSESRIHNNGRLPNFDWHLKLDQAKRYWLDWRVEYEENKIVFALGIDRTSSNFRQGSDIFALGFSNYGQLNSSDFCFIWYDLSHKIHLQDARTNSENKLELVEESESVCKLLKASKNYHSREWVKNGRHNKWRKFKDKEENDYGGFVIREDNDNGDRLDFEEEEETGGTQIEVVFERPLDVCSSDNYYTIDNGTTHLIWFTMKGPVLAIDELNLSDFIVNDERTSSKSSDRFEYGMKRVQLIATKTQTTHQSYFMSSDRLSRTPTVKHQHSVAEFKVDNYKIPAQETTYWCKLFKLDERFESRRYHITKYEAIIEDGNEHVVHHMELFNCANLNSKQESDLKDLYENKGGWSGECNNLNTRPKETEACRRVILAWAMGAHPLEYPEEVGQSIGGYKYSPYVVLEIHYNNVKFTPNLVDNSGLKFEYTSKLRPFDAGILEVGLEYTEKNSIPPNMITPIAGYCVSECTRVAMSSMAASSGSTTRSGLKLKRGEKEEKRRLVERYQVNKRKNIGHETKTTTTMSNSTSNYSPDAIQVMNDDGGGIGSVSVSVSENYKEGVEGLKEGIYVFAAQMHTHLAGIASWTEHIREGNLLNELQRDNHYSPHFQEIRMLPKPVHIAPGDALIHYCLYDTTKRKNITLGGYSTSEEMCVTYLHYYPKIDLEVCKSSVDTKALEAYFAYLAREEKQNTSLRLKELVDSNNFFRIGDNIKGGYDDDDDGSSSTSSSAIKSISENYNSIEWSARRSRELIQFYSQAPLSIQCNRSNGERFPGYWNGIPASQLWTSEQSLASPLFNLRSTYPDSRELVGYRGSRRFNRRHAHCEGEGKPKTTA